jgi:glutamine---fructose-6-phosphate transaminase (isomerizing)
MPDSPVIEGGYLEDILDQPRALSDTWAGLDRNSGLVDAAQRLARGDVERVVLTGMGGSFHALHPLNLQLLRAGFASIMVETSELVHFLPAILNRRTLLIAVSQSGRSAETLRLLDCRQQDCFTIGVTNTPGSPLAERSDAVVMTHAGAEVTVSCKTYVTTLMAVEWAGDVLTFRELAEAREQLSQSAPAAENYLGSWKQHVRAIRPLLEGVRDLFYMGRGFSLAAAGTAGLITKESTHMHAEGMSSAAFRHGPFEMMNPALFAVVFEGGSEVAALNQNLVDDITAAGGRAALVGERAELDAFRLPPAPARVRPICEILPVQMLTLALAALGGREAGKFERASKVTQSE